MLKDALQADLKAAMLARESEKLDVLKGLKSAILYTEVEQGKREEGLDDAGVLIVFKKEAKKRQDAADLYKKGGNTEQSAKELREKAIIDAYLPEQLSEESVEELITKVMTDQGIASPEKKDMGRIIGAVKATGAEVDGAILARLVGARIAQ